MKYKWVLIVLMILPMSMAQEVRSEGLTSFSLYLVQSSHIIESSQGNFEKTGFEFGSPDGYDDIGFPYFPESVHVPVGEKFNVEMLSVPHSTASGVELRFSYDNESIDVLRSASCCDGYVIYPDWDRYRSSYSLVVEQYKDDPHHYLEMIDTEFQFGLLESYEHELDDRETKTTVQSYSHVIYDKNTGTVDFWYVWEETMGADKFGDEYYEAMEFQVSKENNNPYSRSSFSYNPESPGFGFWQTLVMVAIVAYYRFGKRQVD